MLVEKLYMVLGWKSQTVKLLLLSSTTASESANYLCASFFNRPPGPEAMRREPYFMNAPPRPLAGVAHSCKLLY